MVDRQTLEALATSLENASTTPDWVLTTIEWWRQGSIDDQTLWNSVQYLASEAIINSGGDFEEQFPQQTIQLISLGEATTMRAEENIRQDETDRLIFEAIQTNKEWLEEVNLRLSGTVVELGQSITDVSKADQFGGITSFLGGIGTGGLIAVAVVAFFVIRGKI